MVAKEELIVDAIVIEVIVVVVEVGVIEIAVEVIPVIEEGRGREEIVIVVMKEVVLIEESTGVTVVDIDIDTVVTVATELVKYSTSNRICNRRSSGNNERSNSKDRIAVVMREVRIMRVVTEEEAEEEGRRKTLPTFTDKHCVPGTVPGTVPDITLSVACALTPYILVR